MGRDLTVIIPTFNREARLIRLLTYYRTVGLSAPVHIVDSSDHPMDERVLQRAMVGIELTYSWCAPETAPMTKLARAMTNVGTPYVVVCADDDFIVPHALEQGVAFLDRHPDYSVVHGQSGIFKLGAAEGRGALQWTARYPTRSLKSETASERLLEHVRDYTALSYSIHRTEHLQRHTALCDQREFGYFWGELALGGLAVIQGKCWSMKRLYQLREVHTEMDSWNPHGRWLDLFDWITTADFSNKAVRFCDCLAAEVSQRDGLAVTEAQAVVKKALGLYLAYGLIKTCQARDGKRGLSRLRELAKRLWGAQSAWRLIRPFVSPRDTAMTLSALLRPESPYHSDFLPIYEVIQTPLAAQDARVPREVGAKCGRATT